MKRKINTLSRFLLFLVFVILTTQRIPAQILKINPESTHVEVGEVKTILISVDSITNLKAYSIKISYNPSLLSCQKVQRQNFLSDAGSTFFYVLTDTINGTIRIDEAVLGLGGQSGSGNLAEIEFKGVNNGTVDLNYISVDCRDTENQGISVTTRKGIITIGNSSFNEEKAGPINSFELLQNYPNPFNGNTKIGYKINTKQKVSILLFNTSGELLKILTEMEHEPGNYFISLEMNSFPSGIYFYQLRTNKESITKKMILIR